KELCKHGAKRKREAVQRGRSKRNGAKSHGCVRTYWGMRHAQPIRTFPSEGPAYSSATLQLETRNSELGTRNFPRREGVVAAWSGSTIEAPRGCCVAAELRPTSRRLLVRSHDPPPSHRLDTPCGGAFYGSAPGPLGS